MIEIDKDDFGYFMFSFIGDIDQTELINDMISCDIIKKDNINMGYGYGREIKHWMWHQDVDDIRHLSTVGIPYVSFLNHLWIGLTVDLKFDNIIKQRTWREMFIIFKRELDVDEGEEDELENVLFIPELEVEVEGDEEDE